MKCKLEKTRFGNPVLECETRKIEGIPFYDKINIDMRSSGKKKRKNVAVSVDEYLKSGERGRNVIVHMRLSDLKILNKEIDKFVNKANKSKGF